MGMFSDLLDKHAPLPQDMVQDDTIGTALSKGWSSGLRGAGSQLQSVAGMAGELVGADEFAQNRYADANALRAQAQAMAPQIGKWDQVNGIGDTLRYGAGMIGSSLPVSLTAMGAGVLTGGGAIPAMAAAGAVTAPFEIGDVIQKQQADPVAMQQSLGDRATGAILGGVGSAAFQGVVPGMVGKQLTRGATGAVRQGIAGSYGKNVLGDFALEAGAEGGGDIIKQTGANPDAAIDWDSVKENMIGGGIAGGALGHIGFAADMAHSAAPGAKEMFDSAKGAIGDRLTSAKDDIAETAPGKKVKSAYDDLGDMLVKAKTKVDDTVDKVMKGEELGDPKEWLSATTEAAKKRMMDLSDNERVKAATAWAKEMLDDVGLDEAKRNDIADAMGNIKDHASQMFVATAKKAWDAGQKTKAKIDEFTEAVRESHEEAKRADVDVGATWVDEGPVAPAAPPADQLSIGMNAIPESVKKAFEGDPESMKAFTEAMAQEEKPKPTINQRKAFIDARKAEGMTDAQARAAFIESLNPKKSEDYSGANAAIHAALVESGLSKRRPDLFESNESINKMADALRIIGEQLPKGPLKPKMMNKFVDTFGADSLDVLDAITKALDGTHLNTAEVEKKFASMNRIHKVQKERGGLQKELTAMVDADMKDSEAAANMPRVMDNLIAHARGETTKGMAPGSEQAKAVNVRAAQLMQQMFGENTDAASLLIEKAAKQIRDGAPKTEGIGEDAIGKEEVLDENGNDVATYTNEYQDEGAPAFDEQGNRLSGNQKHKVRYGLTPPDKAGKSKSMVSGRAMQEGSQYANQHKLDLERQFSTLDAKGNVVRDHEQNGYSIYFEPLSRTGTTDPSAKGATGEDGRATARTRGDNSDVTVTNAKGDVSVQPGKRFGHIIVENHGNPHEFSAEDLEAMKYDNERDPDGPSKLKVGKHSIDAVRVAKVARNKMQDRFTPETPMNYVQRLVDGFKQGIAMLTEQTNERIVVPGAAIIGYVQGKKGNTPLTWAQAQKMAKDPRTVSDKESDAAAQARDTRIDEVQEKLKLYRRAYKDAKAGGSPERALNAITRMANELKAQLQEDVDEANYAKTKELSYDPNDVRNANAGGLGKNFIEPDYNEISRATAAGATIYTDSHAHRRRAYNVGERKVARHLREQGYNEYEPGVWTRDGAEPTSDGGTGFTLTPRNEYTSKDQRKADYATHYIGVGRKGSATSDYARDAAEQGIPVNAWHYTDKDHVFISSNEQDGERVKSGDGRFAHDTKGDRRFDDDGMLTKGGANEVLQGNYHGGIEVTGVDKNGQPTYLSRKDAEDQNFTPERNARIGDEGFNSGQGRREIGNDENIHLTAALEGGNDSPLYAKGATNSGPAINVWYSSNENADLSNLAARPFTFNQREYASVEHAYQSNKSGKFDQSTYDKYSKAGTKISGGKGTKTEGSWNLKLMERLVKGSFENNPDAAARLLATGDARFSHTQDKGIWGKEFPRILEAVRVGLGGKEAKTQGLKTGQELMDDQRSTAGGLDRGRSNMDGSGHWVDPRTDSGLTSVVDLVHSWSDKTVTSQRIKRRALVLVNNYYKMSKSDQQRFRELAPNADGRVESTVAYVDKHTANATLKATLNDMTEQQLRMELRRREKLLEKGIRDEENRYLIEEEVDLLTARLGGGKFGAGLKGTVSASDAQGLINELARKYSDVIVVPGGKADGVTQVGKRMTANTYSGGAKLKRGFVGAKEKDADGKEIGEKDVVPEVTGSSGAKTQHGVVINGGREAVLRRGKQAALEDAFGVTPPAPKVVPHAIDMGRVPDQRDAPGKDAVRARDNMTKATPEQLEALAAAKGRPKGPKAVAAKKAAFLKRAASGDKTLIEEISTSDDAKGLQRAVDALGDLPATPELMAVTDAINERMTELLLDEDVTYGMGTVKYSLESAESTNPNTKANNPQTSKDIKDYIEKVLGKSVKLAWAKFTHAGEFRRMPTGDLIRLSVHALNPMSTAYHESLHAFFAQLRDAGAHDVIKVVEATARSPVVMKQIREFYKNQPDVLKQLADPEERAAYMYQMWANGKLRVSPQATTVFQKIAEFIRGLLGVWSNDERALHIMDYFNSGGYAKLMGTPNAMKRALMEPGRNKAVETAKTFTEPLARLADTIIGSGSARLEDTEIPALAKLATLIKRSHLEEGGDQGYIPAARVEATKRLGVMANLLGGYPQPVLKDALEALQIGLPAYSAEGRAAVADVKAILAGTYSYMTSAGVKIGHLGPDYFPRVWDIHYVSKNEQALRDMLEPYVRSGEFKGNPTDFIRSLTSRDGNEFGIETSSPGMQHKKTRVLDFLKPEDVAPFLNKDLLGTMASYITQAARKAEWERRFGYDANNPDATKLETIFEEAKQQGATREQLQVAEQYLKGVDGTLGDTIDPGVRRMMGNMVVYQNIRLLPMAAFSMVVDPLGVMVRGGTLTQAYSTFKRGVASIRETYGGKVVDDEATQLAEMVGVVDKAVLSSVMSDLYTQGMVGGTMKKVNDAFFKYNMVEGMNRAFRVGASEAAMSFLAKHADLKASPHSARWMAELGLKAGDIKAGPNGRIALHRSEGLTLRQEKRVHAAINQWVDGAMLRPDAADKPIWMNDPRYALISHLKQFVFTFQHIILGRVLHEIKHGNYAPAMALASYVPVMIAADTIKGVMQGGGDTPEWKKNWDMVDYVGYGVQRAGLLGVGQFGFDVASDIGQGGTGIGALSGPTIEQIGDIMQTAGGRKQFGSTVIDAMPANALYKEAITGGSASEPMHTS